jgi:16S rRNA (adenine1518-N6/adenine1519-N6)-dimethyltransferase
MPFVVACRTIRTVRVMSIVRSYPSTGSQPPRKASAGAAGRAGLSKERCQVNVAHGYSKGLPLKKKYGQHFLRDHAVVERIVDYIPLTSSSSVFEIGCGDGFLTAEILKKPIARLWVFEIDPHWAQYVRAALPDSRLQMHEQNILDLDWAIFEPHKPWILLANLPYAVTFPILHMLQRNRHLLAEGVIMIQEEVAQKIVKTSGKGYGYPSLFFQHYFDWKLLNKVPPGCFYPPPKVDSRLLYFKPKLAVQPILREAEFWKFIKGCFHQPRRTLKNNLDQTHYDQSRIPAQLMGLRAQQLSMEQLLELWNALNKD